MTVGADQGLARDAKPLQMYLVADTVARTGEANAVLLGHAADKTMVICIFKAVLQCVMIDVCHRKLCFDSGYPHCLVFQISHCSRCILCQRLVDAQTDLGALNQFAIHNVRLQNFFG